MHTRKPHSADLRKGRYSENNQIYLLTTVIYQREKVFTDFYFGRLVVHAMREQQRQQKVESLAFVIMPDHVHWLIALKNDSSLAKVLQSVKGVSASKIQRIRRERGDINENHPLWQDGYHDHALRKEEDLQQMARYIVANPLRAGIVRKIGDYPLWDAVWL